jgi:hypothetical protein
MSCHSLKNIRHWARAAPLLRAGVSQEHNKLIHSPAPRLAINKFRKTREKCNFTDFAASNVDLVRSKTLFICLTAAFLRNLTQLKKLRAFLVCGTFRAGGAN